MCVHVQPTDDIVLMAQALEKIFLQKVAQMPQEEVALLPPAPKGKNKSKQPTATTGDHLTHTRAHTRAHTALCGRTDGNVFFLSESAGGVFGLHPALLPLPFPLSDACHLDHAHTSTGHAPSGCPAAPSDHDAVCAACSQGNVVS